MASPAQIHANQLNAQKSTGPRSAEGKAVCAANALTHGFTATKVYPAAAQGAFDSLSHEFLTKYDPADAEEEHYLHIMVMSVWNLRRISQLEEDVWQNLAEAEGMTSLAKAFIADSGSHKVMDKLFRYKTNLDRAYSRAHKALLAAQERRAQAQREADIKERQANAERRWNERMGGIGSVSSPAGEPTSNPAARSESHVRLL